MPDFGADEDDKEHRKVRMRRKNPKHALEIRLVYLSVRVVNFYREDEWAGQECKRIKLASACFPIALHVLS